MICREYFEHTPTLENVSGQKVVHIKLQDNSGLQNKLLTVESDYAIGQATLALWGKHHKVDSNPKWIGLEMCEQPIFISGS